MVVVRIVVAAPSCPPFFLVAVVWPVFVGPAGGGGCLVARPPVLAPFLVFGAGGPPSLVAVFAVWGVGCRGWGGLVWCRPISTSRLASASRRFHLWPIDPLFWRGPLTPQWGRGNLISERASRLDAFSGYPFRTWPTSRAPGGTTGTPEVRPSRSSRTGDGPPSSFLRAQRIGTELSHDVLNPARVPL